MKKKKIGILGYGHWGKNYVRTITESRDINLVGLSEPSEKKRTELAERFPFIRTYNNYLELIEVESPDAVVIATPASTHYKLVKDILSRGIDVLCEKPLTLDAAEAGYLADLSSKTGSLLMVAHTFLFNNAVKFLAEFVRSGALGDIYYIKARRTHLGLIREDVNVLWDLAPHDLSIIYYIFGELPDSYQAIGTNVYSKNKEDIIFVSGKMPSNILVNMHFSWLDVNKERTFEIVGSRARVIFDDLNIQEPIKIYLKGVASNEETELDMNFGEFKYIFREGDIYSPNIKISEPLKNLCNEFFWNINNRIEPISNGKFSTKIIDSLEKIQESIK
jgi:predicted dehydrogenase